MRNIYISIIKVVDKVGVMDLEQRREIWETFNIMTQGDVSAQMKRFRLALECIKKLETRIQENTLLDKTRKDLNVLINSIDGEIDEQACKKKLCKICDFCQTKIHETDDFLIGYFQQAIEHMIQILEEDEPLLLSEYELTKIDEELEIEETDTAYCVAILWKYLKEKALEVERKKLEKEFWLWYVQTAASIQGVPLNYISEKTDEARESDGNKRELVIESLGGFVKAINYEFKYENGQKGDKVIILNVLNMNDDDTCPICGQKGNYYGPFRGRIKLGQLKGWKVEFIIKEKYYHCMNPLCREGYVPKKKVGYKEMIANFKYLTGSSENKKKLSELFERI